MKLLLRTLFPLLLLAAGVVHAADVATPAGMAKIPFVFEKLSPYATVEETVEAIKGNAEKMAPWTVAGVKQLDKSIKKGGGPEIEPVAVIELCNPQHAGAILKNDSEKYASVMMPCRVAVYRKADGKVYIAYLNARLIGEMFGGVVAEVMGGAVADDQEKFLTLTP